MKYIIACLQTCSAGTFLDFVATCIQIGSCYVDKKINPT